ncbi:MAG: SAM-dependent DNA methyltransferase [Dokdonella sp.]|nr:SAM-dependent DNA methyltransferase [Dokdonella sp.]
MPRTKGATTKKGGKSKSAVAPSVELTRELFQAAVALRRTIEPADYKRYVLPILFLRFLSLRYEHRRAALAQMIREPNSPIYGDAAALNDPDEYRAKNVFVVPEEARWSRIVEMARQDDIKLRLDNVLEAVENAYPEKLRGLLPRIYANSNMDAEDLRGLIALFSKDVFEKDHVGEDLLGRIYEYFIGEFASSEGKRGGEYFTPASIVRTLVAMLEPVEGKVFDPCCGSGGMFVQSDAFTKHSHRLSFHGQESKEFTLRLCRMNLFIHGLDGNIKLGSSYSNDQHESLRADYILANPPFNDGAKGADGWGARLIATNDPRLSPFGVPLALSPRNANSMWILHFLHHLAPGGTAGFVMAMGELSSSEVARLAVRRALVDNNVVDCVVQLSGQLFANTQIPCALWFLSKNRAGEKGYRDRRGEVLFIDGRKLGSLIPGSRKQRQLSDDEIFRIADLYSRFKRSGVPEETRGFCRVVPIQAIQQQRYALTPARYVGSDGAIGEGDLEAAGPQLVLQLKQQMEAAHKLDQELNAVIAALGLSGSEPRVETGKV